MSSILDSLRKSDQKRKGSQKPAINSFQLKQPKKGNIHLLKLIFWVILLSALLIIVLWSWKNGVFNNLSGSESSNTSITTGSESKPLKPPVEAKKPEKTQENLPNQKSIKTPTVIAPPDPNKVKKQAIKQKIQTTVDQRHTTRPKQEKTPPSVNQIDKPAKNVNTAISSSSRVNKTTKKKQQNYQLLHELPFTIRKNLPSVKLNIHVFDPKPENRMVVINGLRLTTGDVIEELVTLKEINEDGALFEFQGQLFMILK